VFGQAAGREARAVLEGTHSLEEALARYRTTVNHSRRAYAALEHFQSWSLHLPVPVVGPFVRGSAWAPISRRLQSIYWTVADPDTLEVSPGQRSATSLGAECCESGPAVARRQDRAASSSPMPDSSAPAVVCESRECGCEEHNENRWARSQFRSPVRTVEEQAR
jgi:hypothetical protein